MPLYIAFIAAALAIAALGEGPLSHLAGIAAGATAAEFALTTLMELATLAVIPLTLRIFKFKKTRDYIGTDRRRLRSVMRAQVAAIGTLLTANALLYYAFMQTTFGYLGLIALLCMAFVCPGKGREAGYFDQNEQK